MRFGIISTAGIAQTAVIPAIRASEHEVVAIASRDGSTAEAVAADFDVPRAYDDYGDLLADDDVEAVYNPLPNALHAEWTRKAADAGMDVLCEKPFASDRAEAAATLEYCRDRGVTVMEAFMYRFHPRTERALEVARTDLEDVHTVAGEFHFSMGERTDDIRLDPALDGGSVMDVGCYPISAARQFLGRPDRAYAWTVDRRDSGVDTEMAAVLEYDDGSVARVASGFDTPKSQRYRVEAANGWLAVEDAFDAPDDRDLQLVYEVDGERTVETFDPVDQYRLQVEQFAAVAEAGATPRVDAEETLDTMAIIDAIYRSADEGVPVDVESGRDRG
ncbi:MAG: Gfo/Idh/MocA family protein [Halanaeroarchaeum sp.]